IDECIQSLGRIHVHSAHEVPGLDRGYGKESEIDVSKATPYRSKHPSRTCSITSEIDGFPVVFDDVGGGRRRPPRAISSKPPPRMFHRGGADAQAVELHCLPSIEFDGRNV